MNINLDVLFVFWREKEGRKGCSPVFDWADRQQCEGGKSGLVSSELGGQL